MRTKAGLWTGSVLVLWTLCWPLSAPAQPASDFAVQLSAIAQSNPPRITLSWKPLASATRYRVTRKTLEASTWGDEVLLPGEASEFADTNVVVGASYEYHVWRLAADHDSHAYIYAGIEAPLTEFRGKVLLMVDNTYTSRLGAELAVLEQDLVGDGWTVVRHNVPRMAANPADSDPSGWPGRSNEVTRVKRLIQAEYLADPANVRAVFLFGHVPVPYSGALAPDQHGDHRGAWPADSFYGDMEGTWTDVFVRHPLAADPRNHNVPGDGKFDQNTIPGRVALEVGRVDMADLLAFPSAELELLRQYLFKNHNFRHRLFRVQPRALVHDNLGNLGREVPAASGWGNFSPLVGTGNVAAGRWLSDLPLNDYLWAYGCGPGTYTRATGVAETQHFLVYDIRVVFTMLFGSYFGDWDSSNNLLRGSLAMSTHTLTAVWGARPSWHFHHMGLGETIGFSTRLLQNNAGLYQEPVKMNGVFVGLPITELQRGIHIALMGDPTLRQQPVAPPPWVMGVVNPLGGADLSWLPSSDDPIVGYHVYRASFPLGPYTRLNSNLISGTSYRDADGTSDRYYMVRAVKLETSGSGTYYNASQGVFAEVGRRPPTVSEGNVWAGGSGVTWKINDAQGTAGSSPGWDLTRVPGNLFITATSSNRFAIRVVSFRPDDTRGQPGNFDKDQSYAWTIATASLGVIGFEADKFQLETSEFEGDLGGGVFSLALSEDATSIRLVFTPNHPPLTLPAVFTRGWDSPLEIDVADLLDQFTTDADGDARAVLQIEASPSGTLIFSDTNRLVFQPNNNLPETVYYWVQDVRPYRVGDTVRAVRGAFVMDPNPSALQFRAYPAIELEWQGLAGRRYQVQSRRQNELEWTDEGEPFVGTGEKTSLFQRANGEVKFYRIVLLDGEE